MYTRACSIHTYMCMLTFEHAHMYMHTHVYAYTCRRTAFLQKKTISAPKSHLPCTQLLFISYVRISKQFGPACGPTCLSPAQRGHALLGEGTALLAVGCGSRQSRTIESDVDIWAQPRPALHGEAVALALRCRLPRK